MKIKAIQVVSLDDGNEITVTFKLDQREEYEETDIEAVLDTVRACQERVGSRDTTQADEPDGSDAPIADQPQEGRRRRGASDPTTTAAEPAQSPATDAPSGGRRRRASSADTSSPETTKTNDAPEPAFSSEGGRRRRGASDPTSTQTDAPSQAAPRRRSPSHGETASEPKSAGAGSTKINDADLSKACSQAALVLGPEGVKSVLSEFGVKKSSDLEEKDRQPFLDALKEDLEKAEGASAEPPARRRRG